MSTRWVCAGTRGGMGVLEAKLHTFVHVSYRHSDAHVLVCVLSTNRACFCLAEPLDLLSHHTSRTQAQCLFLCSNFWHGVPNQVPDDCPT